MKLVLTVCYSENIKFKFTFDTKNNTKTFKQLKIECVEKLQGFTQSCAEKLKAECPSSFDPNKYMISDSDFTFFLDNDLVEEQCANKETIILQEKDQINSSLYDSQILSMLGNVSSENPLIKKQPEKQEANTKRSIIISEMSPDEVKELNKKQQQQQPQQKPQTQTKLSLKQQISQQVAQKLPSKPQEVIQLDQNQKSQFYINTSVFANLQQPPADFKFNLRFPQSQSPQIDYTFMFQSTVYLMDVSNQLCDTLNLNSKQFVFTFYNLNGLPYCQKLQDMHQVTLAETLMKTFEFHNTYFAIATQCSPGKKSYAKINHEEGPHQILISHNGTCVIRVDIEKNTVLDLKRKVYSKLNIATSDQSLQYSGKTLLDEVILNQYNIQANSTIVVFISINLVYNEAYNFQDNFYSRWMNHFHIQTLQGCREFRCHLMVIVSHISEPVVFTKFSGLLRDWTSNNIPLLTTLKFLQEKRRLTQTQKIAVEEGFIRLFYQLIETSNAVPIYFKCENILEFSRACFGAILNGIRSLTNSPAQWSYHEIYKSTDGICSLTNNKITKPALLQNAPNQTQERFWEIVDFDEVQTKKQQKEQIYSIDSSQLTIKQPNWLKNGFIMAKLLLAEVYLWIMWDIYQVAPETKNVKQLEKNWFSDDDPLNYPPYKILSAIELKENPSIPVLTKNQERQLVIYTENRVCDDVLPITLYDPITGNEKGSNPDDLSMKQLMSFNTASTMDEEKESEIQVITQISREPDEAILVLLDISYSMRVQFFETTDLQRIGAVKAFFNAFADRTMGYNLRNVVSLAFFNENYNLKCTFTEAFGTFKELVNRAVPSGNTALFDSLIIASEQLLEFKQQYPNAQLRIIALTDGDDTESKSTAIEATKIILKNNIVLDAFVVNSQCQSLKQIAHSTGGRAFQPSTLKDGLRLFEYETILTTKYRQARAVVTSEQLNNIAALLDQKKTQQFDKDPYEMKFPDQIKRNSLNPQTLIDKISQDNNNWQVIAPTNTLKRIMKEMIDYQKSPHPYARIYPCEDELSFWKVALIGPEKTPYAGGFFLLYMQFSIDYPQVAPEVRFVTPIYHCNINAQGRICHSLFGRNYLSDLRVKQFFDCIFGLLMTPEPEDTSETTQSQEYLLNNQQYRATALEQTKKYAMKPFEQNAQEILGSINQSANKEKFEELKEWYEAIQIQIKFAQ